MLSCSTRVEESGVFSEATFSGVLEIEVCPVLDPNAGTELKDRESAFRRRRLVDDERGESCGLSSDAEKGVSDSDPESWLADSPSVSSMNVTGTHVSTGMGECRSFVSLRSFGVLIHF